MSESSLSRFGRAYRQSLEQNRPTTFRAMEARGSLARHLQDVDEAAQSQFEGLMRAFEASEKLPEGHLARAAALDGMRSRAEEIVMSDLLVKDEETEQAMTSGYSDSPSMT